MNQVVAIYVLVVLATVLGWMVAGGIIVAALALHAPALFLLAAAVIVLVSGPTFRNITL
jgi:hypothetical protein